MGFLDKLFGNDKKSPKIKRRTPFNLQVGDVVSYDLEDYIVIGKLVYDDGAYEWYDYQLDSGEKKIWLGSEDDDDILLGIYEDTDLRLTQVPDEIEYDGQVYYLDEHGKSRIKEASGRAGAKAGQMVEYWDYESDAGEFLSVEKWGNEIQTSYGYPVDEHELEFLPGSQE